MKTGLPDGWTEDRIRSVITHLEKQTGRDAVLEMESASEESGTTLLQVPIELVDGIKDFIAQRTTVVCEKRKPYSEQ